ncbi:hypothetical protein T484DRAFT_1935288 [Baffinella frigidus]|nr:hypothetical protein T484DRAFT_1935288 [Cryptophyta sp. CCMP2293]
MSMLPTLPLGGGMGLRFLLPDILVLPPGNARHPPPLRALSPSALEGRGDEPLGVHGVVGPGGRKRVRHRVEPRVVHSLGEPGQRRGISKRRRSVDARPQHAAAPGPTAARLRCAQPRGALCFRRRPEWGGRARARCETTRREQAVAHPCCCEREGQHTVFQHRRERRGQSSWGGPRMLWEGHIDRRVVLVHFAGRMDP